MRSFLIQKFRLIVTIFFSGQIFFGTAAGNDNLPPSAEITLQLLDAVENSHRHREIAQTPARASSQYAFVRALNDPWQLSGSVGFVESLLQYLRDYPNDDFGYGAAYFRAINSNWILQILRMERVRNNEDVISQVLFGIRVHLNNLHIQGRQIEFWCSFWEFYYALDQEHQMVLWRFSREFPMPNIFVHFGAFREFVGRHPYFRANMLIAQFGIGAIATFPFVALWGFYLVQSQL